MRRTVKNSFTPVPRRAITRPPNTCTRSFSSSLPFFSTVSVMTTPTSTTSPTSNRTGSLRRYGFSISLSFLMALLPERFRRGPDRALLRLAPLRLLPRLLLPPQGDSRVVARQEDLRHAQTPVLGRSRELRTL